MDPRLIIAVYNSSSEICENVTDEYMCIGKDSSTYKLEVITETTGSKLPAVDSYMLLEPL